MDDGDCDYTGLTIRYQCYTLCTEAFTLYATIHVDKKIYGCKRGAQAKKWMDGWIDEIELYDLL